MTTSFVDQYKKSQKNNYASRHNHAEKHCFVSLSYPYKLMWIQGTVLSYQIFSDNTILSGVQKQVSWAISHLQLLVLTLKPWMCEQWEQICTWCICKFSEELMQGAMLLVLWSEINILIMRNFEKVSDEEAKTGRTKGLQLNRTYYLVLSPSHLQEECLSFSVFCAGIMFDFAVRFTTVVVLSEYCNLILKILEDSGDFFVVVLFGGFGGRLFV